MADLYSPLLFIAIALTVVAVAMATLPPHRVASRHLTFARPAALSAIVVATGALGSHLALGHRPGTANGLAPGAFLLAHPAPFAVLVAALAAQLLLRRSSR